MAKNDIPAYQIIALANLDLEKHLEDHPLTIQGQRRVKWDVEESEYHYIAKGTLRIPIEIYFSKPDGDETPEVRRVIVDGKRRFDARLEELSEDEREELEREEGKKQTYGVDEDKLRAENFVHYKKNINGDNN
ncbi:MAG: hypothetical protein ACOX69_03115 [Coriobacteriales bacterium]